MGVNQQEPVVLITGAARRLGAIIAQALHQAGYRIIIHYHRSEQEAQALAQSFNQQKANSAAIIRADLNQYASLAPLVEQAYQINERLDVLINNASTFFPTPCGQTQETDWDQLMDPNLKAPYFLAQAAAAYLAEHQGCIVNIADIHGERPLKGYPVYSIAKAGLIMLTQALACELAPNIRVNAIAPGITLLPEAQLLDPQMVSHLQSRTLLKRFTASQDIANAVLFLIQQQSMTGQILNIDCGRSVRQ